LESLDVAYVDTRDYKGREVFAPLHFRLTMFPASTNFTTNWWIFRDSYWPITKEVSAYLKYTDSLSDKKIHRGEILSLHNMSPLTT
jgi:hypothetical protein